ncbi:DUF6232 family protein [Olivibacter sp. CPCC 100613]|uniref:DUF6232 family protein n=1 Tax=Olivibacter sp. CPCC 100613 TaxID=3079931 RepID=UPI002FF62A2D
METPIQNEIHFYQDGDIIVTQSRYIAQATTYAMRNISSVKLKKIPAERRMAIIMFLGGFLMLFSSDARVIGVLLIAVAITLFVYIKDEFAVRISTNAGETNTFISKNREHVQKIVDALNEAIIYGG